MQPKKPNNVQGELFKRRLRDLLNLSHPLCILADEIVWGVFEMEFGKLYVENKGRPGLQIRLLVGLHYLKHTFNESDESVVERFLENPYWQYFCGYEYFQHEFPLDPTSLVRWRKRVGSQGMERLLKETLESAKRKELLKKKDAQRVNADTTVQEKAVAFPRDARLYYKMLKTLVKAAKKYGINLRQSYERLSKRALQKYGRYGHANQLRRAAGETRKLRTYLGRVMRDIGRKYNNDNETLKSLLEFSARLFNQRRNDKQKIYSVHAQEVECIGKGKAGKKYEFGCKVSMVSSSKGNWILAIEALHGNPYDGHTLKGIVNKSEELTGWKATDVFCDKGYRGADTQGMEVNVHLTKRRTKGVSRSLFRWLKRRAAIEPVFGHLKADNRMGRNYLKGKDGDRINAILSACGFNMRKLLRAFFLPILRWFFFVKETLQYSPYESDASLKLIAA